MCIGTWKNGKQCTRDIKRDGACSEHYVNPNQTLKATENFKKCPSPEYKFSDSKYMAEFVPNKDFCKKPGDESKLWTNCCHCRKILNEKRNQKGSKAVQQETAQQEPVQQEIRVPYFPEAKNGKRFPYNEVVKCLDSLGYEIQVTEEEYLKLKKPIKIPALCPPKHKVVKVTIGELKLGKTCCTECGKTKAKNTYKAKTGYDFPGQNPEALAKRKQTLIETTGYDHPLKNPEVQEKIRQTLIRTTGYDHSSRNPETQAKRKETNFRKTGYEEPFSNPEVQEKIRQTNLRKTGYDHYMKSPEFRAQFKQNYFAKTGFQTPLHDPAIREKAKQTLIKNTGYDNSMKNPATKEKAKQTYKAKTGFDSPMHNPEVLAKLFQSLFKFKPYTYPSGRETLVQGFEGFCLDDLIKNEGIDENEICNEIELKNDIQPMPEIWYPFGDKTKRYFPDIFIPSQNRIIEVKAQYIFDLQREKNLAKAAACVKAGYKFEFRFYGNNGNLIKITVM